MLSAETRAKLSVSGAGLLWASAGLIGQAAGFPALVLAELRLAGAALVLCAVLGLPRLWRALAAQRAGVMLAAILGMAAFQWSYFAAVAHAGASFATWTSVATGPLWAAALSRLAGVRSDERKLPGAVPITSGLLLMLAGQPVPLAGLGFSLLAGFAYALYAVAADRAAAIAAARGSLSITALALAGGAVALLPLSGALLPTALQHHIWQLRDIASFSFLALGSTAFAYWLFARGLSRLSAEKALALQWVQPVATQVLASCVAGYHLGLLPLLGMALITLALVSLPAKRLAFFRGSQT
jgi:DME family drug/metabolite transporter